MVFNSYTFIVFFAMMLFLHNLPLPWKEKNKPFGCQLYFLCITESAFYTAALAGDNCKLLCRPKIVH